VIGDNQKNTEEQEHEETVKNERQAWHEVDAVAVDKREQQTADEIGDGFTARQQREGFPQFVLSDQFADERFGTGDDESTGTSEDDGQIDEPAVTTIRHQRQSKDLEYHPDDGQTEVADVEEMDKTW